MEDAPVFLLKEENVTFLVTSKSENSLFLFYKKEGKIATTDLLFDEEKRSGVSVSRMKRGRKKI